VLHRRGGVVHDHLLTAGVHRHGEPTDDHHYPHHSPDNIDDRATNDGHATTAESRDDRTRRYADDAADERCDAWFDGRWRNSRWWKPGRWWLRPSRRIGQHSFDGR
jgi:hypothetical protein